MQVQAVENNIIFQFVDETTTTRFKNTSESGFLISSEDGNQTAAARWGEVVAVGPNVKEVKPNDFILIEPGKWTMAFTFDGNPTGERFWKTDEDRVIATSDSSSHAY